MALLMNKNDIQAQLDKFLQDYPVDYPVEIFNLAKRAGYEVFRFHPSADANLPKISGALVYEKKRIFINGDEAPNRQRFTCAHELGHSILHHVDMVDNKIDFRIDGEFNSKEEEANYFAASLLMPELYLKDFYTALPAEKDISERIEESAKYFQVSKQAMFYRLENIDLIKGNK
jgi:Zn-dependent peptidase ImmA (M78 family)